MPLKPASLLSLAALFVVAGISPLHAEKDGGGPPQGGPGGKGKGPSIEKMQEELGLTPEQVEKIKAHMAGQREKMEALKKDDTLSPEQKKAAMKEFRTKNEEVMKSILTPEQWEKWEKNKKDHMAKKSKERGEDEKPGEGGDKPPGNP